MVIDHMFSERGLDPRPLYATKLSKSADAINRYGNGEQFEFIFNLSIIRYGKVACFLLRSRLLEKLQSNF